METSDTIGVTIDGRQCRVAKGTTILTAARGLGIEIPHLCYHPDLTIRGTCRLCLVEVEKMPKLQTACSTVCSDGMVVRTDTEKVAKNRAGVLEFLLINHPLDCPICDKAGECNLQQYVRRYGARESRYREKKLVHGRVAIGDGLKRNMNRCVACTRCVRFARDIAGIEEYGIYERGSHLEVGIMGGGELQNAMQGCMVDLCPVGALTSKDFRFKARVWTLEDKPSVCQRCAAGCNSFINVGKKDGAIKRIRPRTNPAVNKIWMCDLGRLHYHDLDGAEQVLAPLVKQNGTLAPLAMQDALGQLARQIQGDGAQGKVAVLAGSGASCEAAAAVRACGIAPEQLFALTRREDIADQQRRGNFLIRDDWGPNMAGLQKMNFTADAAGIKAALGSGQIRLALILGCDVFDEGLPHEYLDALRKIAYVAVIANRLTAAVRDVAHLVLPAPHWSQLCGTVVNAQGLAQQLAAARPPACPQAHETVAALAALLAGRPAASQQDLDNEVRKALG